MFINVKEGDVIRVSVAAVILLATMACGGSDGVDTAATKTRSAEQTEVAAARAIPTATATSERPASYEVRYQIYAIPAAVVDITYANASGGTEQLSEVVTPWEETFTMPSGAHVYIAAQGNQYAAQIECRIYVDGGTFKTSASKGRFVIASCNGRLP